MTVPVPPAELTATFTIDGPDEALAAARRVASESGIARDAGPGEMALTGSRAAVLGALGDTVVAALDSGAHELEVRLEAPTESRP